MDQLTERSLLEYVWDGNPQVVMTLRQLRAQFTRYPEILIWLVKNNIRGQALIDFFNDAEGVETRGVLLGVKKILNRIDHDKFSKEALTLKELKQ